MLALCGAAYATGWLMKYLRGTLRILLAQESGQIQLLIIAPILTLSFLSLIVRTASSAVDPALEKKRVTEQLKRRLSEVQSEEENSIELAIAPPPSSTPPSPLQITRQVKRNATLATIMKEEGLNAEETAEWLAVAGKLKEVRRMRPGHAVTLSFVEEDKGRVLRSLSYEIDKRSLLVLERKTEGHIVSRRESLPSTPVWRAVAGRIESNLYNAATTLGVPARIVDDLADMDWDLNFSSDLRSGDLFKIIFEEFHRDGQVIEYGRILAAEIVNKGKTFTLFSIPEEDGSGVSRASQQFLRYPLKFTRISSVFTHARFHPILARVRPHLGVDFAAPAGTPVRAVADGTVTHAGRNGGFGNFVRIDHPGPYDSSYAHLQRISKGVRVGTSVTRGQVIGYVGSTGLATGPHLHFALYKNGRYINPLTAKLPIVESRGQQKQSRQFIETKKRLTDQLATLKVSTQPISLIVAASQEGSGSDTTAGKPRSRQRQIVASSQRSSQIHRR